MDIADNFCLCLSITDLTISPCKRHSPTYQVGIFAKMESAWGETIEQAKCLTPEARI